MTICIAAICDKGKSCVVAADREVTIGFPLNVAFEHHERKIDGLSEVCAVLSAGNALVAAEVISQAKQEIAASGLKDVKSACERLRDAYMEVHMTRAEQVILRPRGLNLAEFKATGAQTIPLQLYQAIDQLFWNFMLGTEFVVAGVDEAGAHIGWIHYHGMQGLGWLEWFDKLGYQAIGSGGSHAAILLSVTGQNRDLTTAETVFNVYNAKVNAEVAPGVGDATDMAIISSTGTEFLTEAFLERLEAERDSVFGRDSTSADIEKIFRDRK